MSLAESSSQRRTIDANTVLFVDAATSCLQKPSANAKELPLDLRGKAMSLEDSSNRKPSRLDHFCDGLDHSKPYLWEEFASATPTFNKDQKGVELSKDRRLWYYLGQPSTESRAHYTGDPAKPINDPASNFLQSVEPAKRPLIPQPQPVRRQSLPASYPGPFPTGIHVPLANAATVTPRPMQAEQQEQQKIDDYQRRMAILGSPAAPPSPYQHHNTYRAPDNQSPTFPCSGQVGNPTTQLPTDPAAREAMLAKQRAILDRSQQRAMELDQQNRPYVYKPKSSMPPPTIGIDTQSVERQREFQRRAYQQSLNNTQLSPHSPGIHPGFIPNGQTSQWDQYAGPDNGAGYVASQRTSPNTAQYGNASPSPTEAAFPLLRRAQHQPILSSPTDPQHNTYQLHTQPISSQQQPASVNFINDQRRFSPPTYPHPQFSHQSQPSLSPPNSFNMSSAGSTAPIDIPQQRANMSAIQRNRGQHTANFIDPNLMQLGSNHQTFPAPPGRSQAANKAQEASRAMPPPPVPAPQSSHAHLAVTSTGDVSPTKPYYSSGYDDTAVHTTVSNKKAVYFNTDLTQILADMKQKESEQAQKTLINDKPVPASIAMLRPLSDAKRTRPNVYASPYHYGVNVSGVDVTTTAEDDEWVEVQKPSGKGKDVAPAATTTTVAAKDEDVLDESEWVLVDVDHSKKKRVAFAPRAPVRQPIAPTAGAGAGFARARGVGRGAGPGLAKSYYSARSAEEKNLIDEEARKMGWYVGNEE
jgi:hypothetical protein